MNGWHASRNLALLESVWEKHGAFFVHQQIIWLQDRPILTQSWYMWQHELCFFGWRKGNEAEAGRGGLPAERLAVPDPGEEQVRLAALLRSGHPESEGFELAISEKRTGGPGETRTPDLRFRKPLLCPTELQAPVAVTR